MLDRYRMCGIAGVLSKSGGNVVPLVGIMLSCMANRGPDGAGLAAEGVIMRSSSISGLRSLFECVSGASAMGHARLAIVGGTCGAQPFRSCDGRFVLEHNGEIYNYKEIKKELEGRHQFSTLTDSEVVVHLLEDYAKEGGLLDAIKRTVAKLDGVYALVIRDEQAGEIALVRDRIGVRQLYYAETNDLVAFASERKALWEIGIPEPTRRVMPGSAVTISSDFKLQSFKVADSFPRIARIEYRTMASAVEAYNGALFESVKKRTQDFERVGIIFSGGIDSVLVAHLAAKMVPKVLCYTCGLAGSNDVTTARHIARQLNLDLKVCELTESDVERLIPEIITIIEDSNAGQVEVALPIYGAVRLAHEDGIKVMLTGQGVDELFGGYSWYTKVVQKEGYGGLRRYMAEDLLLLYKETLEREDKITMAHSVELREPFLDPRVIQVALAMDLCLNVTGGQDAYGKHVHRQLAERLGIPSEVAYRAKEAAQHGSGMHDTIDAIARKHGFDESSVSNSYLDILETREKIGSSQRYGHLFADEKIWTAEPHVQMYLDTVSKRLPKFELVAQARSLRKSAT